MYVLVFDITIPTDSIFTFKNQLSLQDNMPYVRVCGTYVPHTRRWGEISDTHVNDKVHEFVLVHLFRMEVSDQETDVIALEIEIS